MAVRDGRRRSGVTRPAAGAVVIVDWRTGPLPPEPGGFRPAVVVEDADLFATYPGLLVVPLTSDATLAHADLALRIEPSPENGCPSVCWALAHHVQSVSLQRTRITPSSITTDQLQGIRQRIALAVGIGLNRADPA